MTQSKSDNLITESVRSHLEWWKEAGVEYVLSSPQGAKVVSGDPVTDSVSGGLTQQMSGKTGTGFPPQKVTPCGNDKHEGSPAAFKKNQLLEALRLNEIGNCTRCPLHKGRTNLVFGVGNPEAQLMFIGEGPGADEDRLGEPFVGRAGRLLTDMIVKGMGLKRSDVYIGNIVKCRPPGNRNPEPVEMATCIPFLKKQIDIINPKVIVCLGKIAAQALLQTEIPITKLRGEFKEYGDAQVMPTYHPAFLLRNPPMKKAVWEDLQKVMRFLGLPLPKREN